MLSLCAPAVVSVRAQRQEGQTQARLDREAFHRLSRMNAWLRAEELKTPLSQLVAEVEANLLFWAEDNRPQRNLEGGAPAPPHAHVALRPNVKPVPWLGSGREHSMLTHVPRVGGLDDAMVVGTSMAVWEFGQVIGTVTVGCCAEHGAQWNALQPLLDGSSEFGDLARRYPEWMRALDDADLLVPATARHEPGGAPSVGLSWLGQSSLLYQCHGTRILIDPSAPHNNAPPASALGRLDAVLLSHASLVDPAALAWVHRNTLVLVPQATQIRPYHEDLTGLLRVLGFENVQAVVPWAATAVGHAEVLATPYVTADAALQRPAAGWLLKHGAAAVWCCAHGRYTQEVCSRVAGESGRLELAVLGVSANAGPRVAPVRPGNSGADNVWMPHAQRNQWVVHDAGPQEAARAVHWLGARRVAPLAHSLSPLAGGTPEALKEHLAQTGLAERFIHVRQGVPIVVYQSTDARR